MSSFRGGIHPPENKGKTEKSALKTAARPVKVILPLQQNLGCPNEPLVKVGDEVKEGQKIADAQKFISAPLHAPISGKVTRIEQLDNACGFDVASIVIEGGAGETAYAGQWSVEELTPEQIRKSVREAGIVGLGGATFPTHVKLTPPAGKKIDTVIINGCECEPYITVDHRLMLERPAEIIYGARAIAKAVGAGRIVIAIESNKPDAVKKLNGQGVAVAVLRTRYPQGGEKMLIRALTGREVPSGGLPSDVGVVVQNVGTAIAIAEAVRLGKPLIERAVTVTGSGIKQPQNLIVRIGTTFKEVIEQCGGLTDDAAKVIMGGPMTGIAVSTLDVPVVKATSCILALSKNDAQNYEEGDCIRCGRCLKVCPIGLMPNYLGDYAKLKEWDKMAEYHVADCIECGCCSYVCPSKIYLVQYFKVAKRELQTRKAVCK
ncbi:MAG: electron transport complex subunit RsxC [Candidatus Margulisbacteria bacterium]|jgi:electron transport complex protein RnfC|nr:electron transport complex subunit RsxC [Candidatus Margulisiibacteriota bacterium]